MFYTVDMTINFRTKLLNSGIPGTWTYVDVPINVEEHFQTKSRVPVKGTVEGYAFQSSLMPQGNGVYIMVVNQSIQISIGKKPGDEVHIMIDRDEAVRNVELPDDFVRELARNPAAGAVFEAYSYSHKKEYVDWIESSKKPETRTSRIAKAILKISSNEYLK